MKKILIKNSNFLLLAILTLTASIANAQSKEAIEKMEKQYQERITKSELNGIYIPSDLTDAFIQLNKLVDRESRAKFKMQSEEDAMVKLHYSLGRWIWHNWGFFEGSRLSVHLQKYGLKHPEDMAVFIIVSYHRYLNRVDLKSPELVIFLNERRAKEIEERKKQRQ